MHCTEYGIRLVEAAEEPTVSLENLDIRLDGKEWVMSLTRNGTPVCRGTRSACLLQAERLQAWNRGTEAMKGWVKSKADIEWENKDCTDGVGQWDYGSNTAKVIPTSYAGISGWRSRYEARWALFFDALGIKWEYEPQRFDLGAEGHFLPDFWLPQVSMFADVKIGFSAHENKKVQSLVKHTGSSCLMLVGAPKPTNTWGYEIRGAKPVPFDVVMGEAHCYHLNEGRFPSHTGAADFQVTPQTTCFHSCLMVACEIAQNAKFYSDDPQGQIPEWMRQRVIEATGVVWGKQ